MSRTNQRRRLKHLLSGELTDADMKKEEESNVAKSSAAKSTTAKSTTAKPTTAKSTMAKSEDSQNAETADKAESDTVVKAHPSKLERLLREDSKQQDDKILPVSSSSSPVKKRTKIQDSIDHKGWYYKPHIIDLPPDIGSLYIGKGEQLSAPTTLRFLVEASVLGSEILNISSEPVPNSQVAILNRVSLSSGYTGDASSPPSLVGYSSGRPLVRIDPRISRITSSSEGSNLPNVPPSFLSNLTEVDNISSARVAELKNKWKNSDLLFTILDRIDRCFTSDVPLSLNNNDSTSNLEVQKVRKRSLSFSGFSMEKKIKLGASKSVVSQDLCGRKAFARVGRNYYYAQITAVLDKCVEVMFSDNTIATVKTCDLIRNTQVLIGKRVMVKSDKYYSSTFKPGIVLNHTPSDSKCYFYVATDNGDVNISAKNVFFAVADVGPILGRDQDDEGDDAAGCSKALPKDDSSKIDKDDSSKIDRDDSSKIDKDDDPKYWIAGCDRESTAPQGLDSSVKLKTPKGKIPTRASLGDAEVLGPLNFKGKWFTGLTFLITSTNVKGSLAMRAPNDNNLELSRVPFVHDRLVQQIEQADGVVVRELQDVSADKRLTTFVISNQPCVTPKYLTGLSMGMKICSHEWIIKCSIEEKLLPCEEIPGGWSVEEQKFVSVTDRVELFPLFEVVVAFLDDCDPNFSRFWGDILENLGALIKHYQHKSIEIIVVEDGVRVDRYNISSKASVVSAAWVVECCVQGAFSSPYGHSSFNPSYVGY